MKAGGYRGDRDAADMPPPARIPSGSIAEQLQALATAAVTVRAGDTLLLVLPPAWTSEQARHLNEGLAELLPGDINVALCTGPTHVIHIPADRT